MRKTRGEIADILFHAYELGDIDNIFYGGKWDKMSDTIKKELENIELEDLGTIRENAYGVVLHRLYNEIDRNFIFSMLTENEAKNILPVISNIHEMIALKYFTVLKDGKKISAALYATPQQMAYYLEPLKDILTAAARGDKWNDSMREARELASIACDCNPFFHALKSSPEFTNTDFRQLILVVADYVKETFNIDRELFTRSFNNIENWTDLFPRTKRDLEPLFKFARERIGQKNYFKVPQNKITNTIISSFVDKPTAGQLNILHALELQVNKNFNLTFEDVQLSKDDVNPISVKTTNGMKTLVIFLKEYAQNRNDRGDVRISLKEIQNIRQYGNIQTARKQTRAALNELSKIGFQVRERGKLSGYIRLNGGTHYIKNGFVFWNWNQDFLPIIDNTYISDFPIEGLATDDKYNPNAFYLTVFLSNSYRMNEGKSREGKISVMSLIENCPDLKKYIDSDRVKQFIMEPLIRDLDSLEWLNYTWHAPTGEKIEDIYSIPSKDFLKCFIMVDYSDFPNHPDRLKAKTRKTKQSETALINARAKQKAKAEQKNTP